jgi:hypothetical protein
MSCREIRPALRDHAAGAAAPSSLAEHLRSCSECAAALADERSLLAEIDGVVGAIGDEEPSPAFVVRALALDGPRTRPRLRLSTLQWAAAIVALGLGLSILERSVRETPSKGSPAADRPSVAASPSAPAVTAAVAAPYPAPRPSTRPARRRRLPDPIVPPDQQDAILRFAALIESGAVEAPRRIESNEPLAEPQELYLPPLAIAPIEAAEAPSEESR